jgi:hypothetical protein
MVITLGNDFFYYLIAPPLIIYLFWDSWRYLVKKDVHLPFWAKFQIWILEKAYGRKAAEKKRAKLIATASEHIRVIGFEFLILGVFLLITFMMKLAQP